MDERPPFYLLEAGASESDGGGATWWNGITTT